MSTVPVPVSMTEAIEVNGLTKQFSDMTAVDDLDLAVESGGVFGFLGPNGAGKSTTINVLLDFVTPPADRRRAGELRALPRRRGPAGRRLLDGDGSATHTGGGAGRVARPAHPRRTDCRPRPQRRTRTQADHPGREARLTFVDRVREATTVTDVRIEQRRVGPVGVPVPRVRLRDVVPRASHVRAVHGPGTVCWRLGLRPADVRGVVTTAATTTVASVSGR